MNKLKAFRIEIDKIDLEIMAFLAKRMRLAGKIGRYKKQNSLKIADNKREKKIYSRLEREAGKLGLDKSYLIKIFNLIINESKKNQR